MGIWKGCNFVSVPWYACIVITYADEFIYTAAQDEDCNGKTDRSSIAITADHYSVDSVCEGDQSINANLGAIEDVNEGSSAVKDLVQAGKA